MRGLLLVLVLCCLVEVYTSFVPGEAKNNKKENSNKEKTIGGKGFVSKGEALSNPWGKGKGERQWNRKQKNSKNKSRNKLNKRREKKQRKRNMANKLKSNRRRTNAENSKNNKTRRREKMLTNNKKKLEKRKTKRERMSQEKTKKISSESKQMMGSMKRNKKQKTKNWKIQNKKKKKIEKKADKLSKTKNKSTRKKTSTLRETDFAGCAEKIFSYSKMALGIAINVEKQANTANTRSKTVTNKNGKKGDFKAPHKTLLSALGGNASAPKCAGKPLRNAKYKDTLNTLKECEARIKASCSFTISDAIKTQINDCKKKASKLRKDVLDCSKKDTTESGCSCLDIIKVTAKEMQDCKDTTLKIKDEAVKNKNDCITAFRDCKNAQDAAVDGVGTCKGVDKCECAGVTDKTEAKKQLDILNPFGTALKETRFEKTLKQLGLDKGAGDDGKKPGNSKMSRLSQLRLARYDAQAENRQDENKDGSGCVQIMKEWENFNKSGDAAVKGLGSDVDDKETTKAINSLKNLNGRKTLEADLKTCAKESRQGSATITLSIVWIRFYVFWWRFYRDFIIMIKIQMISVTFDLPGIPLIPLQPVPYPIATVGPSGRHNIKREALKQKNQQRINAN